MPGETLEYCITAYNYGSIKLDSYTITDGVPANTQSPAASSGNDQVKATQTASVDTAPTSWDADGSGPGEAFKVSGVVSTPAFTLQPGTSQTTCFTSVIR